MKHFSETVFVSLIAAIMALVIGIGVGATVASNSVEAWVDDSYIYVQVLGETQVHYKN